MKVLVPVRLVVVSTILLTGAGLVRAQSDNYAAPVYGISAVDSYDQRFASLEAELASLRNQLSNLGGDCGANANCCGYQGNGGCGWVVEAEAVIAAYHREDGMRLDDGDIVNPGWDLTPRLTVGYVGAGGTGIRLRWWDYNHNQQLTFPAGDEDFLSVDTFNLDLELYDTIMLDCDWSIEISGGVRMNNFEEALVDVAGGVATDAQGHFSHSHGGVFGIYARRHTYWGALYGGVRGSILVGDKHRFDIGDEFETFNDTIQAIWEIAIGLERTWDLCSGSTAFVRLGAEWQHWQNFSSAFEPDSDDFESHADVGFAAFVVGAGIVR